MKSHLRRGLIVALVVFILMMIWAVMAMFFDPELPNSPIAFTAQRYWLAAWTIISLVTSFFIMVMSTIFSLIFAGMRNVAL
jgi:hypothetical protein